MNKRAYLRSNEGIYTLSPKITIIGREGCDFLIQNITVDSQQAVIEYFESENCFVLKDLNSTNGTYVNECRIQHATIRLADGDVIKFGFNPAQYEFFVEDFGDEAETTATYSQIPITQKQSWQHTPAYLPPQSASRTITSLPVINYPHPTPVQHRHTVSGSNYWTQLPRTPATNPRLGRPTSANAPNRRQLTPTAPLGSISGSSTYRNSVSATPIKQFLPEQRPQSTEVANIMELQNELDRWRFIENQNTERARQMDCQVQQSQDLFNMGSKSVNEDVYDQIRELTDEFSRKCKEVERLQKLVEKMSANSNRHTPNASNVEPDNGVLRQEMEKHRKDLQISNGLVTTLQRDLSNKDDTIKKLNKEIEQLQHHLSEKDVSISALMNKLTRLKDVQEHMQEEEAEKQDRDREMIHLKHKLLAAETSAQEKEEQILSLNTEIGQLQQSEKTKSNIVDNLRDEIEKLKEVTGVLQRSESLLKLDAKEMEEKYKKFRLEVFGVVQMIPGVKSDNNSFKDEEMIEVMTTAVKDKIENDHLAFEKQELYGFEILKQRELMSSIEQFTAQLKEFLNNLSSVERTSIKTKEVMNALTSIISNESLCSIRDVLLDNFENEMKFLAGLESCISDAGPEFANLSLSDCFKRIVECSIDVAAKKSETDILLAKAYETNEEEIRKLKIEHDEELKKKISEILELENNRNEEDIRAAVQEAVEQENQKFENRSKEYEEKLREYEQTVDSFQKIGKEKEEQLADNIRLVSDTQHRIEDLERQLNLVTESKNALEQTLCEQFDASAAKWKSEVESYKEESRQHSITISALNDRIIKLDKENKDLHNKLIKKEKKKESKIADVHEEHNAVSIIEMNNFNSTIANLERCVTALRHENELLKNRNHEYEDTIKGLSLDIAGAEAQLSDLKGELCESQKKEINKLSIENQSQEEELRDVRVKLSTMSEIIENLNRELENQKKENWDHAQQLLAEKANTDEKDGRIRELETLLASERETWLHNINHLEHEGRISTELASIGSQCRGDRHVQIIESQKLALTELRQKMKGIDIARMPTSNVLEINQQMMQLKKELAELRANQALREGAPRGVTSLTDVLLQRSGNRKAIMDTSDSDKGVSFENEKAQKQEHESVEDSKTYKQMKFDMDLIRTTNSDLQHCFELSETSYFHLLGQVLEILDLEKMDGTRTFANLPNDAKEYLRIQREENCQMIIQKISILKEMIQRKDELLQSYEKDLVKLKQAEELTTNTQAQMEHIVQQTRSKNEEVDLLRETLNRTKDLLHQEKRVNSAIKQNKHYVPENTAGHSVPASSAPKYHCPPEDIMGKDKKFEMKKKEKLKRKDYEIKSLKSELYNKDKQLSQATSRLNNLETTMGITSEEPVS